MQGDVRPELVQDMLINIVKTICYKRAACSEDIDVIICRLGINFMRLLLAANRVQEVFFVVNEKYSAHKMQLQQSCY